MPHLILLILLCLAPLAQAQQVKDSLAGTTVNWDNRIEGRAGAGLTVNSGGRGDALVGWAANTNPATLDSTYGKMLSGWEITTITDSYTADSAFIYYYQDIALSLSPGVACFGIPSNWIEGSLTGVYQFGSSSYNNRGHGTAINGTTVAQADSTWSTAEKRGSRYISTTTVTTQNTWYRWNVTSYLNDSLHAGVNFISFLLYDTVFAGGASVERCRFQTSEGTNKPYLLVYRSPTTAPAAPSTGLTRITLAGGTAGTLTNYPVRIRIPVTGIPGWRTESEGKFTLFDSDSTTKLYWCENFSTADSLDLFVRIPSTGNSDSLYFKPDTDPTAAFPTNPSYHNCDSVFLYYENFDGSFQFSQPVTALESVTRAAKDSVSTNPFFRRTVNGADSIYAQIREHSNIFDDSTDPNPNRRYKFTGSVNPIGTTYNTDTNVQLALWTSPNGTTWTHEGRILIVQAGEDPLSGDTIQMEDGFWFTWQDSTYIAFEDKQEGTMADLVGLIVSPDHGLSWQYRGVIIDSSITIDYQSPSSPVVWIENDTLNLIYEGKLGSYKFGGVTYSLEAGAAFLARGTSPYNLIPISNPDTVSGDTHSPILRLGANGSFNDYGMVPHTIRIENGVHYVVCAASDGGALDDCAWFKSTNIVDDWQLVSGISDKDSIWQTYGVANQDLDADFQIFPQSGTSNGLVYGIAVSSNDIGWRTILIQHSNTANPLDGTFFQNPAGSAKGFAFSGLTKSVLSLEGEPLSAKNAVGFYTNTDSFDVNFLADVRLKFTASTFGTDPYFIAGMGQGAITNIAGSGGTSYEHSCLADGFGLQATGSAAWQPFIQPPTAARTTSGFSTLADAGYTNQHWLHMGMSTDTLRWGINYTIDQKKLNDSLDSDFKKISLFAGSHTSSLLTGARAEIDLLRVRKWHPFGPSQSSYPNVALSPPNDSFLHPPFNQAPFGKKPFNQ